MIFVILGTQDKPFYRLIKEIENLKKDKIIAEEIIVQAGSTKYDSKYMTIIDFISMKEFNEYISKSKYIITHGGVGSILDSIKKDKKVIAIPRLKKYEEHGNDHQVQIIEEFNELGYIIGCKEVTDLKDKIEELETFKPKKYQSNNQNMIKIIEDFIDK